jgi:hypothetical protein
MAEYLGLLFHESIHIVGELWYEIGFHERKTGNVPYIFKVLNIRECAPVSEVCTA